MANPLGSSPLNLTFDSVNNTSNKISRVVNGAFVKSIFNNTETAIFPNSINDAGDATSTRNNIHTDADYNISISEIIKYTSDTKLSAMKLTPADFAYLKNVGVFPNNRLIVARRFPSPVKDDLTALTGVTPLATLISWTPDNNDFIDISYGEKWISAEASFKNVLNDLGGNLQASSDNKMNTLGTWASNLAGAIPLNGFMEGLQYAVFKNMGLSDTDSANLPLGNPNLIREAKMRETLGKEQAGSGLKSDVVIKMVVEYEQKFINGVDPTLVYYDIIANALAFGTSDSHFQFSKGLSGKIGDFINGLSSGTVEGVKSSIKLFVQTIVDAVKSIANVLLDNLVNPPKSTSATTQIPILSGLLNIGAELVAGTISKYKIRILGITNALTGQPSTPWHVTIGNPKRPIFCSGDMVVENVKLTLGKTLAFNDLPSSIKIEFDMKNARSLGSQEIFRKFNTGRGRTYKRIQRSFEETSGVSLTTRDINGIDAQSQNNLKKTQQQQQQQQQLEASSKAAQENTLNFSAGKSGVGQTDKLSGSIPLTNVSKTSNTDLTNRQNYLLGRQKFLQSNNKTLSTEEKNELKSVSTQLEINKTKK